MNKRFPENFTILTTYFCGKQFATSCILLGINGKFSLLSIFGEFAHLFVILLICNIVAILDLNGFNSILFSNTTYTNDISRTFTIQMIMINFQWLDPFYVYWEYTHSNPSSTNPNNGQKNCWGVIKSIL